MEINVSKPNVRIVSHDEIYLLDPEGKEIKRICGETREGIPDSYPCMEEAGLGTKHLGVGRCYMHDNKALVSSNKENTYSTFIKVEDDNRTFKDLLNLTDSQDTENLTSIDSEIKLLQALITNALTGKAEIKMKTSIEVARMVEKLGKLKQLKVESAKRAQLDFQVVNKLIKGIMLSVKMHTSPESAKRIIADIIITTINPMMSSGDLSYGDVSELKKLPNKSFKDTDG